tara:strand:- start:213 stop:794 length:582 start_codon:yes stop_codon:yes gene_type:complete
MKKSNREKDAEDMNRDWEKDIQNQVNELSCLAQEQGVIRPGTFPNGRRTSSTIVYPILLYDEFHCPEPTVIGIVLTGLHGKSTLFGISKENLPSPLKLFLEEREKFEGMHPAHWDGHVVVDLFLEAKSALILLPEDVFFARENGWVYLMNEVRKANRSTHRVLVSKMGRGALWCDKKQKSAFMKLKKGHFSSN